MRIKTLVALYFWILEFDDVTCIRSIDNSNTQGRGGGGSYFPYILLNEIQTMFSQLAKQSHRKLSADCSIAHEHIRPVDLPVNTFSNGN